MFHRNPPLRNSLPAGNYFPLHWFSILKHPIILKYRVASMKLKYFNIFILAYLFLYLLIYLFIYLSIYLFTYLFVYLFS